jgi:hypothetical protein
LSCDPDIVVAPHDVVCARKLIVAESAFIMTARIFWVVAHGDDQATEGLKKGEFSQVKTGMP